MLPQTGNAINITQHLIPHVGYQDAPQFYRAALAAETQAEQDKYNAYSQWMMCSSYSIIRRAELNDAFKAAEERWIDCRAAVNVLFDHWMRLYVQSRQECECEDPARVCAPCVARARLADSTYEPTISELLKEG